MRPGIPVVAEEECAAGRIPDVDREFFLVDPLDGTKEFIKGGSDFTVNVALVENHVPVTGVVYAPARGEIWWGDVRGAAGRSAARSRDNELVIARPMSGARLRRAAHRGRLEIAQHAGDRGLARCRRRRRAVSIGSSLKFVLIASGEADVYPRAGPTMEWDTAAGDAVLRAAGGRTFDLDGEPLPYGKPRFFNPGFVATGPYEPPVLRPFLTDDQ